MLLLGAILIGVLVACGQVPPGAGTTPQPKATLVGTADPAAATKDILTDPGKFLGQEVTVEGVLQAEGQGMDVHFYLVGAGEDRIEVTPWVPVEVIQPPTGDSPGPKIMLDYVGKSLRLTGTVEKGGGGFILNVAKAEELP
jgi:hypothetical protein